MNHNLDLIETTLSMKIQQIHCQIHCQIQTGRFFAQQTNEMGFN